MIKYENIIYSANPPKQTNVLWIKAGKQKIKSDQDEESYELHSDNDIIYHYIDGSWSPVGNMDDFVYSVSSLETEVKGINANYISKRDCASYASKYDQLTMPVFTLGIRNFFKDLKVGSSKTVAVPMLNNGLYDYQSDIKEFNGYSIYWNSAPYIGIQDYFLEPIVIWCKHEVGDVLTQDRERVYKSDVITSSWKNSEGVATAGTKAYLQVTIPKMTDTSSIINSGSRKIKIQLIAVE